MQEAVQIKDGEYTLRGFYHHPIPDPKEACVLIFHGFSGCQPGPHFMFKLLSRLLEKESIASLRFDFLGSGESDGNFEDMTFLMEVKEAELILDYAKKLGYKKIGIVGLSMGGGVAAMTAGRRPKDVDASCLWSAVGDAPRIIKENTTEDMERSMEELGVVDVGGLLLSKAFTDEMDSGMIDIYKTVSNYSGPILIVHGDADTTVPIENAYKYKDIFGNRGELFVVKGSDHVYSNKIWVNDVLEKTVAFLKLHLGKH